MHILLSRDRRERSLRSRLNEQHTQTLSVI